MDRDRDQALWHVPKEEAVDKKPKQKQKKNEVAWRCSSCSQQKETQENNQEEAVLSRPSCTSSPNMPSPLQGGCFSLGVHVGNHRLLQASDACVRACVCTHMGLPRGPPRSLLPPRIPPRRWPCNEGARQRLQFGSALRVLETIEHVRPRRRSNLSRKSPLDSKDVCRKK